LHAWSPGFAWSEVAGVFSVRSREEYEGLSEAMIDQALTELRV